MTPYMIVKITASVEGKTPNMNVKHIDNIFIAKNRHRTVIYCE